MCHGECGTVGENVRKSPTCPPGVGPIPVVRGSQVAMFPSPQALEKPGPLWRHSCLHGGRGVVQSHTAASQAAGVLLGQWCQVPGGGPSLRSPLRAFVGSSDKLVRGAGRRPPPNRLSQKGEGNEGWVGGGSRSGSSVGNGGGVGGPNPKESILWDPLRWCPFHRPPGEPWTEGRRPRSKEIRIQGDAPGSPLPFPSCPLWGC